MIRLTAQENAKLAQFSEGVWQKDSSSITVHLKCRGLVEPNLSMTELIRYHQIARDQWNGRGVAPTMKWVIENFQEYRITRRGLRARGRAGFIYEQDIHGRWLPLPPAKQEAA